MFSRGPKRLNHFVRQSVPAACKAPLIAPPSLDQNVAEPNHCRIRISRPKNCLQAFSAYESGVILKLNIGGTPKVLCFGSKSRAK